MSLYHKHLEKLELTRILFQIAAKELKKQQAVIIGSFLYSIFRGC